MVTIIKDVVIKITLTYGSIVGTAICIAGLVHLFLNHDAGGACGVLGIGGTMILGRSVMNEFKGQFVHKEENGNGKSRTTE